MNPSAHLQSQTDIQNLYDTCDIKSWLFHIYDAFDYILQYHFNAIVYTGFHACYFIKLMYIL